MIETVEHDEHQGTRWRCSCCDEWIEDSEIPDDSLTGCPSCDLIVEQAAGQKDQDNA